MQKICSIAFLCRNCQSRAQLENYKFVFGHFGRHSAVIFDDNLSHCTTQGPSSPGTSQNLFHATPTLNWETRAIFSVMSQPSPSDFHGVFKGYHVTLHCLHCLHHLDSRGQQRHPSWLPSSLDPLPSLPAVRPVCLTGFQILGRSAVFAPQKIPNTEINIHGKIPTGHVRSVAILAVSVPLTRIGNNQTWVYLVPLFEPIILKKARIFLSFEHSTPEICMILFE